MSPELIEVKLLTFAIYERYGYDFRDYAIPSLSRRIDDITQFFQLGSVGELQHKVLHDPVFFFEVLKKMTITVSEFYRDAAAWSDFRRFVVPYLQTFHSLKFWSAGCATGEEAFSLAILLEEEGLLNRSVIHATDINPTAIENGKRATYAVETFEQARKRFRDSEGKGDIEDYFRISNGKATVLPHLRKKVLFNHHNLATESSFGQMNAVFCRNTLIYFQPELKERVLETMSGSLELGGYIILGEKESIQTTRIESLMQKVGSRAKIYKKLPQ